jgi:hypothetical protein
LVSEATVVATTSVTASSGGLPRPADYDDFWYEGEDGLWYNEYDDELEEGQFYAEVPEEDGYPRPDLTAVVAEEEEEAAAAPVVQPPPQLPAKVEEKPPLPRQRKESQVDMDPDLKAAQEAAKAASDAAKNLLGGAMSFGGGFLGGLGGGGGGGAKAQQKPGGGGFGLGGFGLGGMMGGAGGGAAAKPAGAKVTETGGSTPKPKPVMKKQDAVVEATTGVLPPEDAGAATAAQAKTTEELQPPEAVNNNQPSIDSSTPTEDPATENKESCETGEDEVRVPTGTGSPAVAKTESMDPKKSVKFEDKRLEEEEEEEARRLLQERAKEERHINRTRTMRPKEKWEWAFNRILKNLEVRRGRGKRACTAHDLPDAGDPNAGVRSVGNLSKSCTMLIETEASLLV